MTRLKLENILLGLVPCTGGTACSFCEFIQLIDNLVYYALFYLILPACVVAMIMAGLKLLLAVGDPQKLQQGKSILKFALLGLFMAFVAYVFIHTILIALINPEYISIEHALTFPGCD